MTSARPAFRAALLSFRLGGVDGVSVESHKWASMLRELGWEVRTVAGSGPVDVVVPGLDFNDEVCPSQAAVSDGIDNCDLVIVENLLSLPLKPAASAVVAAALRGRPAVLRHFDLPWQRVRFADVEGFPPTDTHWRHVVINALSQRELSGRGIDSTVIPPGFAAPGPGRRDALRQALGVGGGEVLQLQPTRAIERKALPDAVALAEAMGAVLWITGPSEEGYEPMLAAILGAARCRVLRGWPAEPAHGAEWSMDDAYAACDFVSFPSRWEGFGLPMVEAALQRRPLVARTYPVAEEFAAVGLRWIDIDGPDPAAQMRVQLESPDRAWLDHNAEVATTHFSLEASRRRLSSLLTSMGFGDVSSHASGALPSDALPDVRKRLR